MLDVPQKDLGHRAAEMILAVAGAKRLNCSPVEFAKSRNMSSASTRALQASIGAGGGFMIPMELSSELIDLLRPRTVVRRHTSRQVKMPKGNLFIGRQNTGALVGYVGEGQSAAYTQESFGDIILQARKAKAIVPISNDLIRFATPSMYDIVINDATLQLAVLEDLSFLRGAGSQRSPKGLRNLVASSNVVASGGDWSSVNTAISELTSLVTILQNAYVPMTKPVWFWSPAVKNYLYDVRDSVGGFLFRREMDGGTFRGFEFAWTQSIPSNLGTGGNQTEVYLVDMDEVIIGDVPGIRIDASSEASYSSDGSTLTNSAFDRDETIIRIIAEHDIAVRHTAAIAVLAGVIP